MFYVESILIVEIVKLTYENNIFKFLGNTNV